MDDTSINAFNLKIRLTDWYQDWFRSKGLNPNMVKLNDQQREELKRLVEAKSGFVFPKDMKIDPAGNLNEKGGWAGLPTGVKIAIIAGATVATAGAAGAFAGGGGIGAGGLGSGATAAGNFAAQGASPLLGGGSLAAGGGAAAATGGGAAAGGAGLFSKIAGAAQVGGRVLGSMSAASAANRGAETAVQLDRDRMQLEADQLKLQAEKSARDGQSDTFNKSMWGNYVANYQPSVPAEVAPYAGNIRQISDAEREAGRTLASQAKATMDSGQYTSVNPQVTPYGDLKTQPGMFERIANVAGPALSFWDLYNQIQRGR